MYKVRYQGLRQFSEENGTVLRGDICVAGLQSKGFRTARRGRVNKQAASKAGIVLLLATIPFHILPPRAMGAPGQRGSNSKSLDSEFLRAINRGEAHKIRDLAAQGAQVDPSGPPALDLDGLQVVEGKFRYGIRPIECLAAPEPMLHAIESARKDSVEALLQLGADPKREFCEDASTAYFFSMRELYVALANGGTYSVRGAAGFLYTSDGFIFSSIRPIPAHPATYLSMVKRLSLLSANAKRRKELQEIAEILRRAGSPELPGSERRANSVALQTKGPDAAEASGEKNVTPPPAKDGAETSGAPAPSATASPAPGKALIYIYRPKHFVAGLATPNIFVNRDYFSFLQNGTYAPREVTAGEVALSGEMPGVGPMYPPPAGLVSTADCKVDWLRLGQARSEDVNRCVEELKRTKTALNQFLGASELIEPDPRVQRCSHRPNFGTNKLGQPVDYWQRWEVTGCLAAVEGAIAWLTDAVPMDRLRFNAEAGKTYYVRWTFAFRRHPRPGLFELVDAATGVKESKDLKLAPHLPSAQYQPELSATTLTGQSDASSAAIEPSTAADPAAVARLCDAARDGDTAKIESLLEGNPEMVFGKDPEGNTALHWAAKAGHRDTAELLISSRASVDATARNGQTPLHVAAFHGHRDVAELLLANKASVNARVDTAQMPAYVPDRSDVLFGGATPLHAAAMKGYKDVAELLLANNAEVNAEDNAGQTPLHLAAFHGHRDVAELLLAYKANVNAQAQHGEAPLHLAASKDRKDVAELLIADKGEVNARDATGLTPLHYAAIWGHTELAELLLAHGAEVDARDKQGLTALHLAASKDFKEVAELLLANKADVNAKDDKGTTPLKIAEAKRIKDMEELLRKHGGRK